MKESIFDKAAQRGEFVKFNAVGTGVEGTFVDLYRGTDGYGNEQIVYVLKDKEGKLWNVGIKLSNKKCIEYMNNVDLGQIVGFRFDKEGDSTSFKGGKIKYINPYADIKYVDNAWIAEQKQALSQVGLTLREYQNRKMNQNSGPEASATVHGNWDEGEAFPPNTSIDDAPPAPVVAQNGGNDTMNAIRILATNKGLVPTGSDDVTADALIVAFTGMSLSPENYTKIIVALSSFTK